MGIFGFDALRNKFTEAVPKNTLIRGRYVACFDITPIVVYAIRQSSNEDKFGNLFHHRMNGCREISFLRDCPPYALCYTLDNRAPRTKRETQRQRLIQAQSIMTCITKTSQSLSKDHDVIDVKILTNISSDRSNDDTERQQKLKSNSNQLGSSGQSMPGTILNSDQKLLTVESLEKPNVESLEKPNVKSLEKPNVESLKKPNVELTLNNEKLNANERELPQPGIRICDVVHRIKEILFRDFILTDGTHVQPCKNQCSYILRKFDDDYSESDRFTSCAKIENDFTIARYELRDVASDNSFSSISDMECTIEQIEQTQFSATTNPNESNIAQSLRAVIIGDSIKDVVGVFKRKGINKIRLLE